MEQPITVGVDLAKSVFQLHGVDAEGAVVLRRQLRRSQMLEFFQNLPPCLVGMEACAGSHHWARALGRDDAELAQMGSDGIGDLRELTDQELASLVAEQQRLRLLALDRNEAH